MPRNTRPATEATPAPTPFARLAALCEVSAIRRGTLALTDAPYLHLCLKLYPEEFGQLLPQPEKKRQPSEDRK